MKKYWEFKNKTQNSADLYLYIEIASWGGGYCAHSAQSFKEELDALGNIDILNVYINSPGGDVFEGVAIFNMLKRHKAKVKVYIDGLAASIASVIAMAGDEIYMPNNSFMMVHNAWVSTSGNAEELRKLADNLEKINTSIRESYLNKAGEKLDEVTLINLLNNESWLTAKECFDYGLCDFLDEEKNFSAKTDEKALEKYKNTPKQFLKLKIESKNLKDKEYEALKSESDSIINSLNLEEE